MSELETVVTSPTEAIKSSETSDQSTALVEQIVVENLVVHFSATRALTRVSLTFSKGTVTSLEGHNGAGKSTLLNVLATLQRPTAGTVRYDEWLLPEDAKHIRSLIGIVAHDALAYPELSAIETLQLYARLYRLADASAAIERVVAQYALSSFGGRPARTYSRGQLQRLSLARATLHNPSVLLFDEPTAGLDQASTERVIAAITTAREQDKIVILVTHDRELAEAVADRRVFLSRGKIDRIDAQSPKIEPK